MTMPDIQADKIVFTRKSYCPLCDGDGRIKVTNLTKIIPVEWTISTCPICKGEGLIKAEISYDLEDDSWFIIWGEDEE